MPDSQGSAITESLARLTHGQRILSVAAEMRRASNMRLKNDPVEMKRCYARALDIMDRLCALPGHPGDLLEYRRWRELAAGLYSSETPSPKHHALLERTLIQLHPDSWNVFFPRPAA